MGKITGFFCYFSRYEFLCVDIFYSSTVPDKYDNCLEWINAGGLSNFLEYLPNSTSSITFDTLEFICYHGTYFHTPIVISVLTHMIEKLLPYAIAAGLPEKFVESLKSNIICKHAHDACLDVIAQVSDNFECMYAHLITYIISFVIVALLELIKAGVVPSIFNQTYDNEDDELYFNRESFLASVFKCIIA